MKQLTDTTWQSDNGLITFIQGDCNLFMAGCKENEFQLAVVDPPYGMPKGSTHGRGKLKNRTLNNGGVEKWDIKPTKEYFDELFRISKNQIIWCGNYFELPATRGFVIWDKEQPFENFSAAEFAWISFQTVSKIIRIPATRTGDEMKIHPTQKPIDLYDNLIKWYAKRGDKIIDTHLGSASIALAIDKANKLDNMNLEFVGIELDTEYFNAAITRFATYEAQQTIKFD